MSCLPLGYLPAEALQDGMVNDGAEGIGPSFEIEAQAVRLAPSGEWIAPQPHETISALLVDLSSRAGARTCHPRPLAFRGNSLLHRGPRALPSSFRCLAAGPRVGRRIPAPGQVRTLSRPSAQSPKPSESPWRHLLKTRPPFKSSCVAWQSNWLHSSPLLQPATP